MINMALIANFEKAKKFINFFYKEKTKVEKLIGEKLKIRYILDPKYKLQEKNFFTDFINSEKDEQLIKANFDQILADSELDLILELEYEKSSLDYFLKILKNSKVLISSNKKIISENYELLKEYEKRYDTKIYFSAAFSPLPLAELVENFYLLDEIKELNAIFSSTTNYILSELEKDTVSMKETIEKAKKNKLIKKDTDLDLAGFDSVYQAVLSANLIYNTALNIEEIEYRGIKGITSYDLIYAEELGYKIKLLTTIKKNKKSLNIAVRPVLLSTASFLAAVDQNSNAIEIHSKYKGKDTFKAENSVLVLFKLLLGDLIKFIKTKNENQNYKKFVDKNIQVNNLYSSQKNEFYIRLQTEKNEIVINKIKNLFSEKNIAEVILHDNATETPLLPVIIISKKIKETELEKIMKEVENLEGVLTVNNIIPLQKN